MPFAPNHISRKFFTVKLKIRHAQVCVVGTETAYPCHITYNSTHLADIQSMTFDT